MGAQSLDDRILALNQRGHTAAETLAACALLRAVGSKLCCIGCPTCSERPSTRIARILPGYGRTATPRMRLKIYPCQLLANADLYAYWQRGEYHPYTTEELTGLIADIKPTIPVYCRVNRVIRDIPSTHVVEGNRRTSLREDVLTELARRGQRCRCIRCREVRGHKVEVERLTLVDTVYASAQAKEYFIQFVTPNDQIAGYLRLSLPQPGAPEVSANLPDLQGAALVREVHVYGQSLPVGGEQAGAAQHIGLGTRLLDHAAQIARTHGFARLAVISAVGTRGYYRSRGFDRGDLYQVQELAG